MSRATQRPDAAAARFHPTGSGIETHPPRERTDVTKPQQPELRRSGPGSTDQDAAEIRAGDDVEHSGGFGKVPEDNRPGHRPEKEQDKPEPGERP